MLYILCTDAFLIYSFTCIAQLNDYVFVSYNCQKDLMRLQSTKVLMCYLKLYKALLINANCGKLHLVIACARSICILQLIDWLDLCCGFAKCIKDSPGLTVQKPDCLYITCSNLRLKHRLHDYINSPFINRVNSTYRYVLLCVDCYKHNKFFQAPLLDIF